MDGLSEREQELRSAPIAVVKMGNIHQKIDAWKKGGGYIDEVMSEYKKRVQDWANRQNRKQSLPDFNVATMVHLENLNSATKAMLYFSESWPTLRMAGAEFLPIMCLDPLKQPRDNM